MKKAFMAILIVLTMGSSVSFATDWRDSSRHRQHNDYRQHDYRFRGHGYFQSHHFRHRRDWGGYYRYDQPRHYRYGYRPYWHWR